MKTIVSILVVSFFSAFAFAANPQPGTVLAECINRPIKIALRITVDNRGNLILRHKGYNGDQTLVVERKPSGYFSPENFKGTIYEVRFTRSSNGRYTVVLGGGFGGGFDFAPSECRFR